jgi:rhodanese-related sulfurtransferase
MVREIDLSRFADAHTDGCLVVDVRDPAAYAEGHVPGALSMPLVTLGEQVDRLPAGEPVYVICGGGSRSKVGAEVLAKAGLDACSVAGGTRGWIETGRAVTTGTAAV